MTEKNILRETFKPKERILSSCSNTEPPKGAPSCAIDLYVADLDGNDTSQAFAHY